MKIRHINNIVIELDEWEATGLNTVLYIAHKEILNMDSKYRILISEMMMKLNRLTEREA